MILLVLICTVVLIGLGFRARGKGQRKAAAVYWAAGLLLIAFITANVVTFGPT